jgi:RHS repeat-associated protein
LGAFGHRGHGIGHDRIGRAQNGYRLRCSVINGIFGKIVGEIRPLSIFMKKSKSRISRREEFGIFLNILDKIHHTEGYVERKADGSFQYNYALKDHLGNTRVTFADKDNNGTIDPNTEINQINHYYPFGLNMEGNWNGASADAKNKYGYNAKELSTEFGLNWNDYGARNYDAAIGKFTTQDRFAEKYTNLTTYQFAGNNPIRFVDINGDSIVLNELVSGGNAGFQTICNNKLKGVGSVSVSATGVVTTSINEGAKLSADQQAFVDVLQQASDNNVVLGTTMNSQKVLFGDWVKGVVDIADMLPFSEDGTMKASALLSHELAEQSLRQGRGDKCSDINDRVCLAAYNRDHAVGLKAEANVGVNINLDQASIATRFPVWKGKDRWTGQGNQENTRKDIMHMRFELVKNFTKNGQTVGVFFIMDEFNISKVTSN